MKKLILTVGLPRCGKSTWAKKQNVPIVNPDSIRLSVHGQAFYNDAEPLVWALAKIMVLSLFVAGHDVVIVDATNVSKKRREFWEDDRWKVSYKIFNTKKSTCIKRARKNNQEYLIPVIERMSEEFEHPNRVYNPCYLRESD